MGLSSSSCRKVQGFNARPNPINAFQRSQSNHRQPFDRVITLLTRTAPQPLISPSTSFHYYTQYGVLSVFFNKIIINQFIIPLKTQLCGLLYCNIYIYLQLNLFLNYLLSLMYFSPFHKNNNLFIKNILFFPKKRTKKM